MKIQLNLTNLLVAAAFAVVTFSVWGLTNRPLQEPPWPTSVVGMSFSPIRPGNNPNKGLFPTREEIEQDIALLDGKVKNLRTYDIIGTLADIPELASKHDVKITLGVWITHDLAKNEERIKKMIDIANAYPDKVTRVMVGNETILTGELNAEEVGNYIDRVKSQVSVPVSTGEPWHVWIANPELGDHADFISIHLLPYWEGIGLDNAIGYIKNCYQIVKDTFPNSPILIAEVGWPSNGRPRNQAIASEANEASFLRRFLALAEKENYDYFIMEAFDQTWKADNEGSVGAYWGVYNIFRTPKFNFTQAVVKIPQWRILAAISIAVAIATLWMLLIDSSTLRSRGRSFLAAIANGIGVGLVWAGYDYANQYLTPMAVIVGIILAFGYLGITLVLLAEAHEMAEASWSTKRRRPFSLATHVPGPDGKAFLPKVSVHVPAYNEPPEMLNETLDALSRLEYTNFEVVVMDNNTKDPAVWQPVEAHCAKLGPRFRFFHVDPLAGYKAGALNFALANTAPDAEIIAVIDSDYQVSPNWLKDLIPHFANPNIGFVQAPQDYRDGDESVFKTMCKAEYEGFFHIGMVTRNDRNAIIEHGTMTMVRKSVLLAVDAWAEWCITEDAELGLKIFEHGYEGAYVEESYGKGLMPDTFLDYKKQRARWAYGAIQIIKRHYRELFGSVETKLDRGQRYHFLAGWLPWIADGINLFYTFAAIIWSGAMIIDPLHVDPPLAFFMLPPILLFVFKLVKLAYLYRFHMRTSIKLTMAAALTGLALSHTIAKAVLTGFVTKNLPFFRTPKCEDSPAVVRALAAVTEEIVIAVALWIGVLGILFRQGEDRQSLTLWATVLFIQSLPYLAAIVVSLITTLPPQEKKNIATEPTIPSTT
ncbi:MAG: glycosyltransferase [Proteobacteria bacterium]|nr:glycosyltransferase [Desulfobulbaceae bacterium]MBU4151259.1 glycosyltransferase [Pseudomonadota bacterium]